MTEPKRLTPPPHLHRAGPDALAADDYDGDDLADARRYGLEAMQAERWRRTVPARFHQATTADFAPDAAATLAGWGGRPDGRNLLLLGPVGTGKSHAAVAAARLVFDRGREVRFMPVVELLDLLRPGGPEGALYDLADVDCLVVDDLGSERATDWTAERLYALINRRWLEQTPTIATTNLAPAELAETLGARVYSRLVGSGAVTMQMTGTDRRRMT